MPANLGVAFFSKLDRFTLSVFPAFISIRPSYHNMRFQVLPLSPSLGQPPAVYQTLGRHGKPPRRSLQGRYARRRLYYRDFARSPGERYNFSLSQDTAEQQKRSDFAIEKRKIDCWGYQLDHGGTDDAVVQLKNWAGTGHDWSFRRQARLLRLQ